MGSRDIDLPQGDGKASVAPTRGMKNWFSTREAGMTVESTVEVKLTCGQSEKEILAAGAEAGRLAEVLAIEGCEEMGLHLDSFMKDVTGQKDPEPPKARRSEHPKHRRGRSR